MKYLLRSPFLLLCLSVLMPGRVLSAEKTMVLKAGAGKAEITPSPGHSLGGYGKYRKLKTKGAYDPLYARAICLQNGSETFLFLSADLVLIDAPLRETVANILQIKIKVPVQNIIIAATHTHTGAGAYGSRFWQRFIMGKYRKPVFEKIVNGMIEASIQAHSSLREVKAEYGEKQIDSEIENRLDEKLNYPAFLKVIRFKEAEKVNAVLVFMAAHPTLFPAGEALYSADFPGKMNSEIENRHPGAVSLFFNGAAADLRPKTAEYENKIERTEAYGGRIASLIKDLNFKPLDISGPWQVSFEKIKLPRVKAKTGFFRAPSLLGGRVFPRHSFFQAVRLGSLVFLAFPGELGSQNGYEIEQAVRMHGLQPFMIGFANDYIAYVIPRRYYKDKNQYESRVSFYGEKMDMWTYETFNRLLNSAVPEKEPAGKLEWRNQLPVLYLKGSAYHIGYEEGRLLKKRIHSEIDQIYAYLKRELPLPVVNKIILNRLLDRAWKKMEPYVSPAELQQIKGIADGSGLSVKTIRRMHAIPEVYPTWCANGAYWGKATADTRLIAIRNLDWSREIRIHEYAAVKFIEMPGQAAYVNIGYAGFSGVLSGLNEHGLSVGQVGAVSEEETLKGTPMPFLLKRILEQSDSLENAEAIFKRTSLTRGYNYLIADAKRKEAIVIEATARRYSVFHDEDPREKTVSYALPVENALFRGDPALDPDIRDVQKASKGDPDKPGLEMPGGSAYEIRYKKQGELILQHYGRITPETAKEMAKEIAPGSNIQSVIYAYPDFWVANAKEDLRAVDSEYYRFSFKDLELRTKE